MNPTVFDTANARSLSIGSGQGVFRYPDHYFRQFIEGIEDHAVFILDQEGHVASWNVGAMQIGGYLAEEVIGRHVSLLYTEEEVRQGQPFHDLRIAMQKGRFGSEGWRLRKDGSRFWTDMAITAVRDQTGNFCGFSIVMRDITKRKRAEESSQSSEEHFRQLAENIREVFWMTTADLAQIIYISPSYESIWGRSRQSLYNNPQSWMDAIHPEDLPGSVLFEKKMRETGTAEAEFRVVRPDGSIRWIHDRAFRILNEAGKFYRITGIAEDITKRKLLEQRLSAQYVITRILSEASTLGEAGAKILQSVCEILKWDLGAIWNVDSQTNLLHCDQLWYGSKENFTEFAALSHANRFPSGKGFLGQIWMSGKPIWIPNLAEGTDFDRSSAALQNGLRSAFGFPIRLGNETLAVVEFFSCETRLPDQELLQVFDAIGCQIGQFVERKRAQENLQRTHGELELRILARTADLMIANGSLRNEITERKQAEERLKISVKEKEVLLKEIQHRVKNNLQVISSLLNLQSAAICDQQALQQFNQCQNRIKSMALVYEQLHHSKEISWVDFAEYLRRLTTNLMHSYGMHSEAIRLDIRADDIIFGVDTVIPCGLIISELVSNAFKHAFPSGKNGTIQIDFHIRENGAFQLRVCDDGIGFPEKFGVDASRSLGLQLTKTLTDQLGGSIAFRSNGGAVVEITFHAPRYDASGNQIS